MPLTYVALAIIALLGLFLAAELIRLGRPDKGSFSREALEKEFANAGKYEPLIRLFVKDDVEFLACVNGLTPERRQKLWNSRRKVMSLYLRDIWRDFHRSWSVCKFLAPLSDDPEFGTWLVNQRATFYLTYASVWSRFILRAPNFEENVQSLAGVVQRLRESAYQMAQSMSVETPLGIGANAG